MAETEGGVRRDRKLLAETDEGSKERPETVGWDRGGVRRHRILLAETEGEVRRDQRLLAETEGE